MHIKSITIHEYRGIQKSITFDLDRESIIPLIGVNECGKTTILEAILSFDHTADTQNRGRHLKDIENLYSLKASDPRISAIISINNSKLEKYLEQIKPFFSPGDFKLAKLVVEEMEGDKSKNTYLEFEKFAEKYKKANPTSSSKITELEKKLAQHRLMHRLLKENEKYKYDTLSITRNLRIAGKPYSINLPFEVPKRTQNKIAQGIVKELDFILYFDDFRHDVPTRIQVDPESDNEWTQILKTLFNRAHRDLDLFKLPEMDSRKREAALSRAESFLNKTLTEQWEKFHLEDRKSLDIRLKYHPETKPEIELDIRETTDEGESYFFGIKDRSKGFFWFFNFVMRLEFNPKLETGEGKIIYLLDEPGSYLHSRAQDKLCLKLMELSRTSRVFYCTHSHHLLDPNVIPYNSIRIVHKSDQKEILTRSVFDRESDRRVDAAFQPVFEALQVRPAAIDLDEKRVLVVEGLYDFLSFSMFKDDPKIAVLPGVNAHSIQNHISWLLAWGVDYRALWDNDDEGRKKLNEARKHFGDNEAELRFKLLPLSGPSPNVG